MSLSPKILSILGLSPQGQTLTHFPQRIHGDSMPLLISFLLNPKIPETPLIIETPKFDCANPIIGPPIIILAGGSTNPPQFSIASSNVVPILSKRFLGSFTALPLMVVTL